MFCIRSSRKEKEDDPGAKKALFPQQVMGPHPPEQHPLPPLLATPESSKGTPLTPSDCGTPRSTSSFETRRGPGRPRKELTMPTLADCPANASKEQLAKWWKQKQTEFWRFKKLTGPEADEYRRKETARVKRVLSRKKGVEDDDNGVNPEDEDDHNTSDMQVKRQQSKEQSRIR